MFDRIVSVDWSGADNEMKPVDLRVAAFDAETNQLRIVNPPFGTRPRASWSRHDFRTWIVQQLHDELPILVAMDFGFGLPWGSDQAVFGVSGWRDMVRTIAERYEEKGTAQKTAEAVNDEERFGGHGPYRFNPDRNDFRFYSDNGVAYYRLTELIAPQAMSQWYCGSGGKVSFHTITGLSMINDLIEGRRRGGLDFVIWPQETLVPDGTKHVLVESYPAIRASSADSGSCRDEHQQDAWKVLQMLVKKRDDGMLPGLFRIKEQPFGRIAGVDFEKQIQFEGFIIGMN